MYFSLTLIEHHAAEAVLQTRRLKMAPLYHERDEPQFGPNQLLYLVSNLPKRKFFWGDKHVIHILSEQRHQLFPGNR